MSNKGKLLGFGALGLALLASSKKASSKTVVQDVDPLSFSNNSTIQELIDLIKTNGSIRTLLKGDKGDTVKGDKGDTGLAGSQIQNYGGSIIKNGALELGTVDGWSSGTIDGFFGMPILKITTPYVLNTSSFLVNPQRIYKATFYSKCAIGNFGLFAVCYDFNETAANKSNGSNVANDYNNYIVNQSNFVEKTMYLGGEGNLLMNFSIGTRKIKISTELFNNSGNPAFLSSLIFEQISLGEAVPHNLPYLPLNQTVLNNTTGKVGIFNGSTVDYFM